jgi:hypothetical protein
MSDWVRAKLPRLIETNKGTNLEYFVRPFYRDCFQMLVEQLKQEYCNVTCTGTPGIGKSVFIHYFIEEYLKIQPKAQFVLSVFSANGKHVISQWIHLGEHGLEMKYLGYLPLDEQVGLPDGTLIHLYDGWSELGASRTNRCIAFPSPNYQWFKENEKSPAHEFIYFPLWTFEELEYANHFLQLGIDDEDLAKRYYKFGGIARFTLTSNKNFYDQGVNSLQLAYDYYFRTYDDLMDAFKTARNHLSKSADVLRLCHRLFYYVPMENFRQCRTILGSSEIVKKFDTLILTLKAKERNQLVRSLDVGFAGSIVGRLFEVFVYERFIQGIQLNLRPLLGNEEMETNVEEKLILKIPSNSYFRIKSDNPPLSELFFNALLLPDDPNMESVDGAFVDDSGKILYMFQITLQKTHQVSGDGLVKLVEMLQKTEAVAKCELEPRLVFIVPEENEAEFSKQPVKEVSFVIPDKFNPTKALEFGAIKGLRQTSVDKLINEGAQTLGDLKGMFEAGKVKYKAVEQYFKPRNQDLIKRMRDVKQFVASIKFPDDNKVRMDIHVSDLKE